MVFKGLLYTDARRNESVHGGEGFQFQAISDGVAQNDEDAAKTLLYVVPRTLLGADTPVEDYPHSFAYTAREGRFYVARGKYLGRVGDGRSGNQVTHCLMTESPSDILPNRPAQLFSAPVWALHKASSTRMAETAGPLLVGADFDLPALGEMVLGDPAAVAVLPVFLTMIEMAVSAQRTRCILLHPDLTTVVRWIALGTSFLDSATALTTAFRAFSANPLSDSSFPIVGTSPRVLDTTLPVARAVGVNVLDLTTFEHSPVTPSPTAVRHAEWFRSGDTFAALEAIDVSRRWGAVMDPDLAARAAGVGVLGLEDVPDAARAAAIAVRQLAEHELTDDLDEYGEGLLTAITVPSGDDLQDVVRALWAVQDKGFDNQAPHVALAALERAASNPRQAHAWADSHIKSAPSAARRPVNWPDEDARHHAAGLLAAFLDGVADDKLATAFVLARDLGTGLAAQQITGPLQRLARMWVREPELTARSTSWLHGDHVLEIVLNELAAALDEGDGAVIAAVRAGLWDQLADVAHPPVGLAPWLAGRRIARAELTQQVGLLQRTAVGFPASSWPAFLDPARPDVEMLTAWLGIHRDVPPDLGRLLDTTIENYLRDRRWYLAMQHLFEVVAGCAAPELRRRTIHLIDQGAMFRTLRSAALRESDRASNKALQELNTIPAVVLQVYYDQVAQLVVVCRDHEAASALLDRYGDDLGESIAYLLKIELEQNMPRGLYLGVRLLEHSWAGSVNSAVQKVLVEWCKQYKDTRELEAARQRLSAGRDEALEQLLRSSTGIGGWFRRGTGRK